jgi:hypothetical protein
MEHETEDILIATSIIYRILDSGNLFSQNAVT